MPEVNSLILNVKSDTVEKGADRLDHLTRSAATAGTAQKGLATSSTATASAIGASGAATATATKATTGYTVSTKAATGATIALGTAMKFALGPIIAVVSSLLTLGQVVSIAGDLEHALSGVSAVTGAIGDDIQELEDVARSLGATTVFSAKQAADGMQFLGMAGFETNEIIAAMPGLLDLAAAGQLELAEASDIASNVLSGFRLEAEEAGRVGDVLAKGAASANTSVIQLGNALSFVSPVSAALGKSIEETAAAIGVLSDNGIQGQRAGTGLRTVFSALSKITPVAERALAELGLTVEDVDIQSQSLEMVLRNLSKAGLDAKSAFKIFGTEGAAAALALTSQVDSFATLQESLENAEGAAGEMAVTLSDDLHGSYKKLGSAASEFALVLDENIQSSEVWRATIDVLTESINELSGSLRATGDGAGFSGQGIRVLVAELDRLEEKKASLGGGALISKISAQADITAIKSVLAAFSENEIAMAKAQNTLATFTEKEAELSEVLTKRFLETKKHFEERVANQERSERRNDSSIASMEREIWLLGELIEEEKALEETRTATGGLGSPEAAPTRTATGGSESKEFERLQRQLQTEEEAIESSYQSRLEIIRANTIEASELRLDLETRAAQERNDALLKIEETRAAETDAIQRAQLQNFQTTTALAVQLTSQFEGLAEEGTNTQKALFAVGKGISIAQAIVNTELAATRALAEGGTFAGIPLANVIRTFGYASVGLMAGQTIGSFATGGIVPGGSFTGDNLTANVNSGEMILNGQQQARLFNIADNSTQSIGTGNGINVTVENYGSSEITVEQISKTDVRIIARDAAQQVVREEAPGVIAKDLGSANSRTSKALSQNTKTERRR